VLAVVQHHQLVADREHLDDAVDHGSPPLGAAVGEPQRRGEQRHDVGGPALAELDEQGAVAVPVGDRRGAVPRQPCLAHSARTAQRHHPAPLYGLEDARDVGCPADERTQRHPQPGRPCPGTCGRRRTGGQLLAQHPPLQLAELDRRVEPELVGEPGAQAGERRERVTLAPGGHQGLHEDPDDLLPQRLRGHQRLELRDGLRDPAHGHQRRGVLLGRPGPQCGEPRGLGHQLGMVQLRVRAPPPQRQRRLQTDAARGGIVEGRCRGEVVGEGRDVDVRPTGVQPVALGGRGQPEGCRHHAAC